jgi:hypothetical protein
MYLLHRVTHELLKTPYIVPPDLFVSLFGQIGIEGCGMHRLDRVLNAPCLERRIELTSVCIKQNDARRYADRTTCNQHEHKHKQERKYPIHLGQLLPSSRLARRLVFFPAGDFCDDPGVLWVPTNRNGQLLGSAGIHWPPDPNSGRLATKSFGQITLNRPQPVFVVHKIKNVRAK